MPLINSHTTLSRLRDFPTLDAVERLTILSLYVWLSARLAASMTNGEWKVNALLLISEGLVIIFILIRHPAVDVSRNPSEWGLAIVATCGPLLVNPSHSEPLISPGLAASIWLVGTMIQVSAKLALGRSFGCVPAHRGLKRQGPYRFIRHPMYVGYLLSHIAFLLTNPTLGNLAIYALCDAIQVPRILVEERLLGRDPHYHAYRADVPWRFIPGVF